MSNISLPSKVTFSAVEENIVFTQYFTMDQLTGVENAADKKVTLCYLTLKNGTKIIGINYGAITDLEHCPEMGKKLAKEQAYDKVFELMGYELRTMIKINQKLNMNANA